MNQMPKNMYTIQQQQAIYASGQNILVSASAGSGKTMVLVERIMRILNDTNEGKQPNINDLLVVTFTKAAAREMKERIQAKIKDEINENTENKVHFIQQLSLIGQANISTIHSFCTDVIKKYYYIIDMDPVFRMLTDEAEIQMLKEEVLGNVIEKKLEQNDASFENFLSMYSTTTSLDTVKKMIFSAYNLAISKTHPEEWIDGLTSHYSQFIEKNSDLSTNESEYKTQSYDSSKLFKNELYNEVIYSQFITTLESLIVSLKNAEKVVEDYGDNLLCGKYISRYKKSIEASKKIIDNIKQHKINNQNQWNLQESEESFYQYLSNISKLISLPGKLKNQKFSDETEQFNEEVVKTMNNKMKGVLNNLVKDYFLMDEQTQLQKIDELTAIVQSFSEILLEFHHAYQAKKASIKAIDFNDLEHKTYEILQDADARKFYQDKFYEIMIDEYQDVNSLQEEIMQMISKDYEDTSNLPGNRFMVGDMKQSIYGFRQANPQLFKQKYDTYHKLEEFEASVKFELEHDTKIILKENFRSNEHIINFTNKIFEHLMDNEVGDIDYTDDEKLAVGNKSFPDEESYKDFMKPQILLFEKEQSENAHNDSESYSNEDIDSYEGEINMIAQEINGLVKDNQNNKIFDKKLNQTRNINYKDIVILTPSRTNSAIIRSVFNRYNIPFSMDKNESYFQRTEILTMMSLLKIIDNPQQDIPLVAVMRSPLYNFNEKELATIRIQANKDSYDLNYYNALLSCMNDNDNETSQDNDINKDNDSESSQNKVISDELVKKIQNFLQELNSWRNYAKFNSLVDLIWKIYDDTHYLAYVGGLNQGEQRQSNLHALYERAANYEANSFKGLFQFIKFIEHMQKKENDLSESSRITEDDNAVHVMTIHGSKGLEFPIVFLAHASKRYNLLDAQGSTSIDSDYGFGTDYIDTNTNIKYPTWVNSGIKYHRKTTLISEELRKLYVALTRAEQKLYITGEVENVAKAKDKWSQYQTYDRTKIIIPTGERLVNEGFLNLIIKSLSFDKDFDIESLTFKTAEDINVNGNNDDAHENNHSSLPTIDLSPEKQQEIDEIINYNYGHTKAVAMPSFQSVSELKRIFEEPADERMELNRELQEMWLGDDAMANQLALDLESELDEQPKVNNVDDVLSEPKFLSQGQAAASSKAKGTATHLVLQRIDLQKERSEAAIEEVIQELVANHIIEEDVLGTSDIRRIHNVLSLDYFDTLNDSSVQLRREVPFSMIIEAIRLDPNEVINDFNDNDQVLIHGVIDGFIKDDANQRIYLFDYKTDYVKSAETLITRYRAQMTYYKEALASVYPDYEIETHLISTRLNQAIPVTI